MQRLEVVERLESLQMTCRPMTDCSNPKAAEKMDRRQQLVNPQCPDLSTGSNKGIATSNKGRYY